jgi:hypothetical protein
MTFTPLVSFHKAGDTFGLNVEIVVDAKHKTGVVCNVEPDFERLIEVCGIGDEDPDVEVLRKVSHVVATAISLDPAFPLKDGSVGLIWRFGGLASFQEKVADDVANAILKSLTRKRLFRELFNGHGSEKRI